MTPNDFGIIRQADHNLFACLFPTLMDISEYDFEIVYPEYQYHKAYSSTGAIGGSAYCDTGVIDISKYDYVLAPAGATGAATQSPRVTGQRDNPTSGAFDEVYFSVDSLYHISSYALSEVKKHYLCATIPTETNLPVIGFIRKRSDGANPKGIINPIPDPDPNLKKEAPEQEEDLEEKE